MFQDSLTATFALRSLAAERLLIACINFKRRELMPERKQIPKSIEAEILIASRRRCCICFGLGGDLGEKQGQIAHLDQKREN
jgi:hypothetical protein